MHVRHTTVTQHARLEYPSAREVEKCQAHCFSLFSNQALGSPLLHAGCQCSDHLVPLAMSTCSTFFYFATLSFLRRVMQEILPCNFIQLVALHIAAALPSNSCRHVLISCAAKPLLLI